MKHVFIRIFILLMLVLPFQLAAQDGADYSRSIGKIYVVVAVILVIFLGIVIYLISLDRKISKLEKRIDNE